QHTPTFVPYTTLFRSGVNPVARDDVTWERPAGIRVVDDRAGQDFAEVAGEHLRGRHRERAERRLPTFQPLEVAHEEQLVRDHRTDRKSTRLNSSHVAI